MQYSNDQRDNSLKQTHKLSSCNISFCDLSNHNSIINSLCGCFSKPTDFKPLATTLPSTLITLNPVTVDIDNTEDHNDNNGMEINQQFEFESSFKRYHRYKDRSKPSKIKRTQ